MQKIAERGREAASNLPSAGLTALLGGQAPHLVTFTAVLLVLLYGYEIFNFTLSIDEEIYTYELAPWRMWVAQGRWAMGIFTRVFPPISAIPELATVLFCAGLGFSGCVLARLLFRAHAAQWAFAGIFVSSPLWPHIAEFNSLSWGVGIGCVLLTLSLIYAVGKGRLSGMLAAVLLAVATGIYQSFFTWFLVLLCLWHLSVLTDTIECADERAVFPSLRTGGVILGGFIGYLILGQLCLTILSVEPIYVGDYWRLTDFSIAPAAALERTIQRSWHLVAGDDPIFLGYGHVLTLLSPIGLAILIVRAMSRLGFSWRILLVGGYLVGALALALSPIVASAGTVPARALISWIPVTAFLAGIALTNSNRLRKPLLGLLATTLFVSVWVSVSLFYTDHVARQRDQLLATRLLIRIDSIVPSPRPARIPFVVLGAPPGANEGTFRRVEIFGDSFFEHDAGNPWRIAYYLRILGVDMLEPRGIADVAPYRAALDAMPVWPAPGSVAMHDDIVVIKLGKVAPAQ